MVVTEADWLQHEIGFDEDLKIEKEKGIAKVVWLWDGVQLDSWIISSSIQVKWF